MSERVTYLVAIDLPPRMTREAGRIVVLEAVQATLKQVNEGKDPHTLVTHHPTVRRGE